jgi:hypothetical protein
MNIKERLHNLPQNTRATIISLVTQLSADPAVISCTGECHSECHRRILLRQWMNIESSGLYFPSMRLIV